jgi:hypothetical protein
VPRGTQDTGLLLCLRLRDSHPVSLAFPEPFGSARRAFCRSYNPGGRSRRFGLLRFRSPLLAESFLFLRVLRCFTSPGSLSLPPCRGLGVARSARAGFPHSDTAGSSPAHGFPALFAVYHVLLRPGSPRHPPSAFCHFFSRAENTPSFSIQQSAISYQLTTNHLSTCYPRLLDALYYYSLVKVLRLRRR